MNALGALLLSNMETKQQREEIYKCINPPVQCSHIFIIFPRCRGSVGWSFRYFWVYKARILKCSPQIANMTLYKECKPQ